MSTLNNVVLFVLVLVLFGSVGSVSDSDGLLSFDSFGSDGLLSLPFGSSVVEAAQQPACFGTLEMSNSRAEERNRVWDKPGSGNWYVTTTWEVQVTDITDPDDTLHVSWDYEIEVSGIRYWDKERYSQRYRDDAWFRFRAGASSGSFREQIEDHIYVVTGADTMNVDDVTFNNVRCY